MKLGSDNRKFNESNKIVFVGAGNDLHRSRTIFKIWLMFAKQPSPFAPQINFDPL